MLSDYANVDVPTLIVWGENDETLSVAHGYALSRRLPDARLCVLRDAKHSIPVEHPRAAANLVRTYADPVRRDATAVGLQSAREIHD
jgi:pimeloyl-ACP methyl ester carboxylesterase